MTDSTQKNDGSVIRDPDRFRLISAFAGHIAHEFNNFLTPLTAYPQLIKEDLPAGTQNVELLDAIEKTARDMTAVMRQLMSLSSNLPQTLQLLDINSVVEKVVSQLRMCPEANGIEIEFQAGTDLPRIRGAETEIHEAIEILCSNGIEAISGGGRIAIKTEDISVDDRCSSMSGLDIAAGRHVRVSVSDTGDGIADHVKDRIFEPFVTTRKGMNRRRAGLGLTIAHKVARDHYGAIDYVSTTGKGATFMLYFPVERDCAHDGGSTPSAQGAASQQVAIVPRDKSRLIVADDEKTIQRLFSMILSSALPGTHVDLASNGAEALAAFSSGHHGALVMDLHMPVMDGQASFTRIEQLCRERNWEMPPTVFCTGFAPPDVVRNLVRENPIHGLLSKPVSTQALIDAVKSRLT